MVSAFCFYGHGCWFFAHDPLLLLYVDDMIITGDDPEFIAFVKARLSEQFLMSDLGPLRYFIGIEVSSTHEGGILSISRKIYSGPS